MIRQLLLAAAILLALLARPAQTVGVEAWHDSAVPASAFSVVTPRTAPDVAPGQSGVPQGATRDPEPSVGPIATGTPLGDNRGGTPSSPSLRAVPRLAAVHASASLSSPSAASMTGISSWFAYIPGGAAAGPALRSALGSGWRGVRVTVCAGRRCMSVVLTGFMRRADRLIDLSAVDFQRLAPLSAGLVNVEVSIR